MTPPRFTLLSSILILLVGTAPPSSACTPVSGLVVATPSFGPVPLSTRVHLAAEGYPSEFERVELVDSNANRVPLTLEQASQDSSPQRGYRFVYAPPSDLPSGDYRLELTVDGQIWDGYPTVRYEGSGEGLALNGTPTLEDIIVEGGFEWGYECGGEETYAHVFWTLPRPPGGGWIAEAIDVATGTPIAWQELTTDRTFSASMDGPVGTFACFGLKIYDSEHREVWSETYPCIWLSYVSGCGCQSAQSSWSGAALLLGGGVLSLVARSRKRRQWGATG